MGKIHLLAYDDREFSRSPIGQACVKWEIALTRAVTLEMESNHNHHISAQTLRAAWDAVTVAKKEFRLRLHEATKP